MPPRPKLPDVSPRGRLNVARFTKDTIIYGERKRHTHSRGAVSGDGITAWEIVLMKSRPEVVNAFLAEYAPPVLDPFCGGGSIPLEAQRLGLRVYASDLNPVPVLITKALIEIPPKFAGHPPVNPDWQGKSSQEKTLTKWQGAQGLAEDVRYYGKWIRDESEKRIGHLYPIVKITDEIAKDRPDLKEHTGQELPVVAWLWARTVSSPNPAYRGLHVPLIQSYWVSTKAGKRAWIVPIIDRINRTYNFKIRTGNPSTEDKKSIQSGTKIGRGCKFRCLLSGEPIPESHVKEEGMKGRLGMRLLAIVAEGPRGRLYLNPLESHQALATALVPSIDSIRGIDSPIALDKRTIWCLLYGLDRFDKLFTARQLLALTTFSDLISELHKQVVRDAQASEISSDPTPLTNNGAGSHAYADAVSSYLACALARCVDYNSSLASWRPKDSAMRSTFAKQGLPMVWDFAEANPLEKSSAGFSDCIRVIAKCVEGRAYASQ